MSINLLLLPKIYVFLLVPGLACQKLSFTFSPSFLVPLENTDTHFELKVRIVNESWILKFVEAYIFVSTDRTQNVLNLYLSRVW